MLAPCILKFMHQRVVIFPTVIIAILGTSFLIGFITQLFGVFTFPIILSVNIVILGVTIWKYWPLISISKIDWIAIGVAFVAGIYLWQVHYHYTGIISTNTPPFYEQVENYSYPYPYYADEWYALAFVRNSNESQSLPTKYPFVKSHPSFVNLELAFHTTVAEWMKLFMVDPLTSYVPLTIVVNVLIVVAVYVLLKTWHVTTASAVFGALSTLYITTGGNMPGLWYLIPINIGLLSLLCSFILLSRKLYLPFLLGVLITLLFYPPLIVFILPSYFVSIYRSKNSIVNKKVAHLGLSFVVIVAATVVSFFFLFSGGSVNQILHYIVLEKLTFETFTQNALPQYQILKIILWPIIIFSIIGAYEAYRKKIYWIIAALVIGLGYWALYSGTTSRIVIEYERDIFVTAVLISAVAGLGADRI